MYTQIHYNNDCVHNSLPLAAVRLAFMNGLATGDFAAALEEIAAAEAGGFTPLYRASARRIKALIEWKQGLLSPFEVCRVLDEFRQQPEGSYPSHWPAELQATKVMVLALGGEHTRAHALAYHSQPSHQSPEAVALGYAGKSVLAFVRDGVEEAYDKARAGWLLASKKSSYPCLREYVAVHYALMLTVRGQGESPLDLLAGEGLRVDIMPAFWERGQSTLLQQALRVHFYRH